MEVSRAGLKLDQNLLLLLLTIRQFFRKDGLMFAHFKKSAVISIILFFTSAFLTSINIFADEEIIEKKMNVAVVEFQVKGDIGIKDAGAIIAEWMISALVETGKFSLNERVLLAKVLEEQALQVSGLVDERTIAAQAGRLYGVEAIITGSVLQWGKTTSVTIRLIDTSSGEIVKAADVKVQDVERIPDRITELAYVIAGPVLYVKTEVVTHETYSSYDIVGTWKRWVAYSNSLAGFKEDGTCEMKHVFKTKSSSKRSSRYRASAARRKIDESDTSTRRSKLYEGIWIIDGNNVEARWHGGFIDNMTISDDGTKMTGQNNWGFSITCVKISDEVNIER